MAVAQGRPRRTATGGRYKDYRKKRDHETGNVPALTKLGPVRKKNVRMRGGHEKKILLSVEALNLFDPKTKKASRAIIKNIVENPANRHFVRRNIITKGTIVETDKGKAKITNRPGQEGTVNGVLI
ncbi:MAG: 30S ribosomal protein S8e [DPANN group archaeon]|nr:30S ribosomal protein S8e [DPANN group archaeon]